MLPKRLAVFAVVLAALLSSPLVVRAAEDAEQQEQEEDNALVSLKQTLADKLQAKWAVDEQVKATCCLGAFDLCEKPPNITNIAFNKQGKKNLGTTKKKCSEASTSHLNNKNQICNFYEVPMNCAYTPNTEDDFNMYFENLPICCEKATASCKFGDEASLFTAKRACIGFAARTAEQLCDLSNSKDCQNA